MIVSPDRKHCYLVDFGIALSEEESKRLTGSDSWVGTPGYMSPEQEEGKKLDSSDDLYVLGGCLYEALCGHRIQPENYQALNSVNEVIPPAIDSLVQRCIDPKPTRLSLAAEFRSLLKSALLGHRTLSEILGSGQLHEVAAAIREMTPTEFMGIKAGQRLLVLQKCNNLVADDDRRLETARMEFLSLLTPLGVMLEPSQYKRIIAPAIKLGYGYVSADGEAKARGNYRIREAINTASKVVQGSNHHIVVESLLKWMTDIDTAVQMNWFYHSVRQLLSTLLANQSCSEEDAPLLAEKLCLMDDLQRVSRAHESDEDNGSGSH
jgi:serine/threonine protein kinase